MNDGQTAPTLTPAEAEAKAAQVRADLARIIQLKATLDSNKPLYEELDRLTLNLKNVMGVGSIPINLTEKETMYMHNNEVKFLAPNQVVTIVDNFAEKNTVFRPAGVKRFEASLETIEEYNLRLEKEAKKKAKDAQK